MAVMLSALRARRPLPPGRFLVPISVRGWVDPRATVRLEGLGQLKKFTSTGLEPATFRLVPQCLNQLRYRVPPIVQQPEVHVIVKSLSYGNICYHKNYIRTSHGFWKKIYIHTYILQVQVFPVVECVVHSTAFLQHHTSRTAQLPTHSNLLRWVPAPVTYIWFPPTLPCSF
jgi:hypothetical protein